MASLPHTATLLRREEVLMLGWTNTGHRNGAKRAQECGAMLIKFREEE